MMSAETQTVQPQGPAGMHAGPLQFPRRVEDGAMLGGRAARVRERAWVPKWARRIAKVSE